MRLSGDDAASHAALVNIQNNLLPTASRGLPLADVIEEIETTLVGRRATINTAMAAPGHTLVSVVTSLLDEHRNLSAGAPGGAVAALGAGATSVDKDGQATTLAAFKALEARMVGYNLLTEVGRRDALAAALAPGDVVLATRVVFREYDISKPDKGCDRMATRNSMLGELSNLRAHLHEYINWYMRFDMNARAAIPRLEKYEFASLSDRRPLDLLTSLALDQMDLIAAPHGMLGFLYRRDALAAPISIDVRDYYCTVSVISDLSDFVSKLLKSFGVPDVLPAGANGYTFATFCAFYSAKLKLAGRLPLLLDQYEHLEACSEQFKAALVCMRITLQAVLGHADVGSHGSWRKIRRST